MNDFNLKKNFIKLIVSALIILILCITVIIKERKPALYSKSGFYFDTIIEISLYCDDKNKVSSVLDECMLLCQHYENLFSRTKPNSDIYKINSSLKSPVKVDKETIELIKSSIDIAKESNGLVDPTIGYLSNLWKIGSDDFQLPDDELIIKALSHVNYSNICIDEENSTVCLKDELSLIDLGFIAKGYIADRLKDYIISEGIYSGIINLGGNILAIGSKPNDDYFKIGIKNPINASGQSLNESPLITLDIKDKSVVSSGNYERFSILNGQRYHHILSTKNGYPTDSGLSQVTIISSSSIEGDMLSTLSFILGYEEGSKFLNKYYPDVEYIFVNESGKIIKAQQ